MVPEGQALDALGLHEQLLADPALGDLVQRLVAVEDVGQIRPELLDTERTEPTESSASSTAPSCPAPPSPPCVLVEVTVHTLDLDRAAGVFLNRVREFSAAFFGVSLHHVMNLITMGR